MRVAVERCQNTLDRASVTSIVYRCRCGGTLTKLSQSGSLPSESTVPPEAIDALYSPSNITDPVCPSESTTGAVIAKSVSPWRLASAPQPNARD